MISSYNHKVVVISNLNLSALLNTTLRSGDTPKYSSSLIDQMAIFDKANPVTWDVGHS